MGPIRRRVLDDHKTDLVVFALPVFPDQEINNGFTKLGTR